jgi:FkbH-like protein
MSSSLSAARMDGPADVPAWVQAKRTWRKFVAEHAESGRSPDLRIGIAASFTAHNLVQFVGAPLISAGYRPQIIAGPYNQLFQICLDPRLHFGMECDAIVLLWRIEDLLFEETNLAIGSAGGGLPKANEKISSLVAAISNLRSTFAGAIIVSVPPLPVGMMTGPLSLDNPTRLGSFHRAVISDFVDRIAKLENVRLLDLDATQRQVGYDASFDTRQWYLYRQPFSDPFLYFAGAQIGRIVLAGRRSSKKCIVLDCDNTLWGGIVGEDGLDGIEVGAEYPGSAFCDFQRLLLNWRKQGIFLAILSKNNESDVWEVFERHSGMVLERTDISAWQINWSPKAENLPRIASALNIGVDSLVFVDDNPMEVAYMQKALPEVVSLLLPEDPAEIVTAFQSLSLFDRLDTTAEDLARADMMRAEIDRGQLSANLTKQEFLQELQLRLDLSIAGVDDLNRVAQVINKTNQFNLTTIRRTLEEVRVLANSSDHRVYALRVSDRFGDYGLTGVAIIRISPDRTTWIIDSLMLSCRVLGRNVEAALLAILADEARAGGASEFVAAFVPTKKNSLAATFLPDHGFKPDGDRWRLALAQAPAFPTFIQRVNGTARGQGERAA